MSAQVNGRQVSEEHAAMFKTAFCTTLSEFVSLVRHSAHGDFWSVKTIAGEGRNVFSHELEQFCL